MRPLERPRPPSARPGPGPTKLRYRLHRAWAKPWLRSLVTTYVPIAALGVAGLWAASLDPVRLAVQERVAAAAETLAARPEFTVRGIEIAGADAGLEAELRAALAAVTGRSSLKLDLEAMRRQIEAVGAVRTAGLRIDADGILRVRLTTRVPAAVWRTPEGTERLVDAEGVEIADAVSRTRHPELPLLLGEGAPAAAAEVLSLMRAAPEIVPRTVAFIRVGARRWTLALEGGMQVWLPAEGAVAALGRVMAWQYGDELEILERDIAVIDMRLPARPTLRLNPGAVETLELRRVILPGEGRDT